MHITVKSHTCLSAGSRLHGISQPPWLCAVSKFNHQAICAYQICAHQDFACRNRPHRRAPRPPARKTQKSGQPKSTHAPQLASKNIPRTASDSSLPDRLLGTRAALTASSSTDPQNLRLRPSSDLTRALTRLQDFWHLLHALVDLARACHASKSAADVI